MLVIWMQGKRTSNGACIDTNSSITSFGNKKRSLGTSLNSMTTSANTKLSDTSGGAGSAVPSSGFSDDLSSGPRKAMNTFLQFVSITRCD